MSEHTQANLVPIYRKTHFKTELIIIVLFICFLPKLKANSDGCGSGALYALILGTRIEDLREQLIKKDANTCIHTYVRLIQRPDILSI